MSGFDNEVMYAVNWDFRNVQPVVGQATAAGNLPIGTGGTPQILVGNIVSTSAAITVGYLSPNITITANPAVLGQTITGNTGGALPPTAGNWNIVTSNSTVRFSGVGSTLTEDFGLDVLLMGSSGPSITVAQSCVGVGLHALNAITSALRCTAVGVDALALASSANNCTAVGNVALAANTTANNSTAVGFNSLRFSTGGGCTAVGAGSGAAITSGGQLVAVGSSALTAATGDGNTAVGFECLSGLTSGNGANTALGGSVATGLITGAFNILIGQNVANTYTGSESSNIIIGHDGIVADNNIIRIGTQGSGNKQQLQTHIAGVINTVSGRVVKTTVPGAYPYTTLTTDYVILVDTSAARTINLVASPVTGTTYRIKDNVGTAAAFNITITPAAGTIDGAASFVINTNWGSADVCYNGTSWRVL